MTSTYVKPIASTISENIIQYAPRDDGFKKLIKALLKLGEINKKYIEILTDVEGMKVYSVVFTHKSADPINNYEFYEILGDATLSKIIPWYIIRRFPQLKNPEFVTIIARLKINMASKRSFSTIAQKLGMWKYVTADTLTKTSEMKKTLEDVFEAFFGATELMLEERCATALNVDEKMIQGIGSIAMFKLGSKLFDSEEIKLSYTELVDAKTRLKELIDMKNKKDSYNNFIFNDYQRNILTSIKSDSVKNNLITTTTITAGTEILSVGSASLKTDSEQIAAENALSKLKSLGIQKEIPAIYQKLANI